MEVLAVTKHAVKRTKPNAPISPEKMAAKKERAERFAWIMSDLRKRDPDLSVYKICKDTGLNWNTIWYLEKKQHAPSAKVLQKLERYHKGVCYVSTRKAAAAKGNK